MFNPLKTSFPRWRKQIIDFVVLILSIHIIVLIQVSKRIHSETFNVISNESSTLQVFNFLISIFVLVFLGKYIACLLTCLTSMLHIALPYLNILSKIDLAEKYGKLPFNLDFYTEVLDLEYLVNVLDTDPLTAKYKSLNSAVAQIVENYGLVSFLPLDVENQKLLTKIAQAVDKCVGRFL